MLASHKNYTIIFMMMSVCVCVPNAYRPPPLTQAIIQSPIEKMRIFGTRSLTASQYSP